MTVTAFVPAGRILPLVQMQGDEVPAILVDLEGTRTNESKSATSSVDDNDVAVVVIAERAKIAYQIASACRDVLDGFAGESDGVQIAECRFVNWATDEADGGRLFILSSAYNVATMRGGATAVVSGTVPTGPITIREVDGAPTLSASTLIVPNGSLTASGNDATLTFPVQASTTYMAAVKQSTQTSNIGKQLVTLGLDTEVFDTDGVYSFLSNTGVYVTPNGRHIISVHCEFRATTNHELPHVELQNFGEAIATGTTYITGQHGDDHASLTIIAHGSGVMRLRLQAFNEADGTDEIVCDHATMSIVTIPS